MGYTNPWCYVDWECVVPNDSSTNNGPYYYPLSESTLRVIYANRVDNYTAIPYPITTPLKSATEFYGTDGEQTSKAPYLNCVCPIGYINDIYPNVETGKPEIVNINNTPTLYPEYGTILSQQPDGTVSLIPINAQGGDNIMNINLLYASDDSFNRNPGTSASNVTRSGGTNKENSHSSYTLGKCSVELCNQLRELQADKNNTTWNPPSNTQIQLYQYYRLNVIDPLYDDGKTTSQYAIHGSLPAAQIHSTPPMYTNVPIYFASTVYQKERTNLIPSGSTITYTTEQNQPIITLN